VIEHVAFKPGEANLRYIGVGLRCVGLRLTVLAERRLLAGVVSGPVGQLGKVHRAGFELLSGGPMAMCTRANRRARGAMQQTFAFVLLSTGFQDEAAAMTSQPRQICSLLIHKNNHAFTPGRLPILEVSIFCALIDQASFS
jgi:hypothetical protein